MKNVGQKEEYNKENNINNLNSSANTLQNVDDLMNMKCKEDECSNFKCEYVMNPLKLVADIRTSLMKVYNECINPEGTEVDYEVLNARGIFTSGPIAEKL